MIVSVPARWNVPAAMAHQPCARATDCLMKNQSLFRDLSNFNAVLRQNGGVMRLTHYLLIVVLCALPLGVSAAGKLGISDAAATSTEGLHLDWLDRSVNPEIGRASCRVRV